mgnify:CR=1 FL=1
MLILQENVLSLWGQSYITLIFRLFSGIKDSNK